LPNVAGQDEIQSSQAEFIGPNFPRKGIETISSTFTLGGQQNKGKGASCASTGLTGLQIGLTGMTASSKVLQNKSKPRMVKPKKPEIGIWKIVQAKGHNKHQMATPKPIGEFPAKPPK
jgi:hypothetical protein